MINPPNLTTEHSPQLGTETKKTNKLAKHHIQVLRQEEIDLCNELTGNGCIELGQDARERIINALLSAYTLGVYNGKN